MIHVENIRGFNREKYPNAHIVKIDRSSVLGNPFRIGTVGPDGPMDRERVIQSFRKSLNKERANYEDKQTGIIRDKETHRWDEVVKLALIAREKDVVLLCWCAPLPCHGDVIKSAIEYINNNPMYKEMKETRMISSC